MIDSIEQFLDVLLNLLLVLFDVVGDGLVVIWVEPLEASNDSLIVVFVEMGESRFFDRLLLNQLLVG